MKRIYKYPVTVYRNKKNLSDFPRFLTFIVTFRCNARCIMCDSWKKEKHNELTAEQIKQAFLKLPKLDAVRLSGGEPFLRKDFPDIFESADRILKPFSFFISTNGFLTDRIIDFCAGRNKKTRLNIVISLDGYKEKHDSVRGTAGAWDKAVRTVKELTKYKKQFNCRIIVNQTIVDEECIDHYSKLHDYLKQYGITNNIVMADLATATYKSEAGSVIINDDVKKDKMYVNISADRLYKFFMDFKRDLSKKSLFEKAAKEYYIEGINNRIIHNKKNPNPGCVALNSHLRLLPDGSIPVCQFNSNTIGNLSEQSFNEIWNSDLRKKYRNWVSKCPGCWAECEILPNAVYSGSLAGHILLPKLNRLKK
ncbi:MAG: radical SAM protein [Spirochaetes bacterium]|nr:radical SAM protein [Spirochaetota bacterium]